MKHFFGKMGAWLKKRLMRLPERDHLKHAWWIVCCFIATLVVAVVTANGNPTGATFLSRIGDVFKAIGLDLLAFLVSTMILAVIFTFIYLPVPRIGLSSFIYTAGLSITVLYKANSGTAFSIIVGLGYSLVAVLLGFLLVWIIRGRRGQAALISVLVGLVMAGGSYAVWNHFGSNDTQTVKVTQPSDEQNPGNLGSYEVSFMTYGSGEDIQREEYGEAVDEITPSVDASSMVTRWSEKRKEFWDFGPENLPLNARVWTPSGQGPFPVILMVHGNHTMENFSTDGYDYLGKQLTSRGFITISVDEDFINYSNITGQPNDNYELRAWMMLQHLVQLREMNQSSDSILYNKIDFNNVALMGHSRGGQAASMAADYQTFFDEDKELMASLRDIHIKAVAALAPTDKTIDQKKAALHNISYLALQGAQDADITDFRGDRQFYRTTFDANNDGMKSTLYIPNANHVQFNTSWGKTDLSMPRGLFLSSRNQMDADKQRQIAKVYLSAFFERVFHGETGYDALFQDYRSGSEWLPDTLMVNKYRSAVYEPIEQFDADDSEIIDADGFKTWDTITPLDRGGSSRSRDALKLNWQADAVYELKVFQDDLFTKRNNLADYLVLTMANASEKTEEISDIDVELETWNGDNVTMPLSAFMPLPPVIKTAFTPFGIMDDLFREGKYEEDWEPVFQTIDIPFEVFENSYPDFKREEINLIKLNFHSPPGEVLLEEIGVR